MSVDIDWETITSGPDGQALSETIRDFIHSKFQQIDLPRFINAVHVHSFEFGSSPPDIQIKDICDPLPDFYEDDEADEDTDGQKIAANEASFEPGSRPGNTDPINSQKVHAASGSTAGDGIRPNMLHAMSPIEEHSVYDPAKALSNALQARLGSRAERQGSIDTQGNMFPRSGTPGIPGGTSNLSYFHLPVGGFSGAQTPLAALAGRTPFSPGWHQESNFQDFYSTEDRQQDDRSAHQRSDSVSSPEVGSPFDPSSPDNRPERFPAVEKVSDDFNLDGISLHSTLREDNVDPSDLQVIARVSYDGDVRLMLTAEILVDYPMPSFVGIPLKLAVTGLKFDGIAIIAYIKRRMHFCFLDPDDAQTLVGDQMLDVDQHATNIKSAAKSSFGSLIREVQIESEIGRQEDGKQVLKNVGKVEKFVLEQVKKIFEEEFVYPSFWTFLV